MIAKRLNPWVARTCCTLLLLIGGWGSAVATADDDVPELSIAPADHVTYPDDRPEWLDDAPELAGDPHRWPVVTLPVATEEEADTLLEIMLPGAVASYMEEHFDRSQAVDQVDVSADWIQEALVAQRYAGTVTQGDGEQRFEAGVLLVLDASDRQNLRHRLDEVVVRKRLVGIGSVTAGLMVPLVAGTMFFGMLSRVQSGVSRSRQKRQTADAE